jgi:opacity protein-like surface antigen
MTTASPFHPKIVSNGRTEMNRLNKLSGVLLAVATLPAPLPAQDDEPAWPYRLEIFGDLGRGRFANGTRVWGKGLDYGGGAGIRPFSGVLRGLGFEFRGAKLSDEAAGVVPSTLDSRLFAVNAVYHFRGTTRVQPYILGGLGFVTAEYFTRCDVCVFDVDPTTGALIPRSTQNRVEASKTGITLGGGVKVAVHRHLSIRPELFYADTTPGSGWNWNWFRLQIAVGLHF